ncbi:MAG TPA: hypothetical protein VJ021_01070 [Thermoplasmata archaeon]|nr:hypothetical protein [Thermoplasmata archaeon]
MNSADSILPAKTEPESWREKVYAALPLFLVGGLCTGLAVYLYLAGTTTHFGASGAVLLRPWILFVALGITGLSAGVVALFAEDALEAPPEKVTAPAVPPTTIRFKEKTPGFFGRSREGYPGPTPEERPGVPVSAARAAPGSSVTVGPGPLPTPGRPVVDARTWDESSTGPTEHRRYPKEVWDESPEEFEAAASKPAPPAVVLSQLDDIEKSLRKKPTTPPAD